MARELRFGRWEKLQASGSPPSVRFGHSTTLVEDDMYVFGGGSYDESEETVYHNDLFRLDCRSMTWSGVEQLGDVPSPREGAVLVAFRQALYLYGGTEREGATSCSQELFLFDIVNNTWTRPAISGTAPKALSMSGVLCEEKIVTFGGVLSGKGCNSLHALDLESLTWTEVDTHGKNPKPRCDHSCAVMKQNMFVCAGTGSDELWFNDLHRLSFDCLEWKEVEMKGAAPQPRDYSTLVSINDWYLVLYGGSSAMSGSEVVFSDLHYIDITSGSPEWCLLKMDGDHSPPSRYSHSMIVWNNKLVVFGGQDSDSVYNDIWSIDFTLPLEFFCPTSVPQRSYQTSVPVPAPRRIVRPATPPSVKPRDFEQLRSTCLQRINEMFDSLSEHFLQLDKAREALTSEREAFEREKSEYAELHQRQQGEMAAMLEQHRTQNEEWVERMRAENDAERKQLAEQKAMLEKGQTELAADRQAFTEKSRKLDAIMKQVQGLQET